MTIGEQDRLATPTLTILTDSPTLVASTEHVQLMLSSSMLITVEV